MPKVVDKTTLEKCYRRLNVVERDKNRKLCFRAFMRLEIRLRQRNLSAVAVMRPTEKEGLDRAIS